MIREAGVQSLQKKWDDRAAFMKQKGYRVKKKTVFTAPESGTVS